MTTNKNNRILELERYNETYTKQLDRAIELLNGLTAWDKKTINKTFFENFFTVRHENGDIVRDYKNKIRTSFNFSDKDYESSKYAKRIYLHDSLYIEVQDTTTAEVLRATNETIEKVTGWKAINEKRLADIKAIDEKAILKAINDIKIKYNAGDFWIQLLDQSKFY